MKDLRIVFMGTPEFAVASLEALITENLNVVGVITAPDKRQGRGQKPGYSPVKVYAQSAGLNILQPTNLKDPGFIDELKKLQANLQVVVAFRMLPESVWNMPEIGTFNLHASLLPQYRGAAPINWAIINGEKTTGVTTFFLKHEIDTGDIIFQETVNINDDDNAGTLYQKLMTQGARLVVKTVRSIEQDQVKLKPQVLEGPLKSAPKIFKEDCEIEWSANAADIRNFVRGLSPYPAAWTTLHGQQVKIFDIEIVDKKSIQAGIFTKHEGGLLVDSRDKKLRIRDLQIQGKKRMKTEDFLRGYHWPDE